MKERGSFLKRRDERSLQQRALRGSPACETLLAVGDWLDGSREPIWLQTWPTRYGDADVARAFDALDAAVQDAVERGAPLSLVVDISRTRVGTPVQRKRISQTFRRTAAIASELVVCQAFVVRTKMQQGALTATLWLFRPGWPIRVFARMDEALAWAEAMHRAR